MIITISIHLYRSRIWIIIKAYFYIENCSCGRDEKEAEKKIHFNGRTKPPTHIRAIVFHFQVIYSLGEKRTSVPFFYIWVLYFFFLLLLQIPREKCPMEITFPLTRLGTWYPTRGLLQCHYFPGHIMRARGFPDSNGRDFARECRA